MTEESALSQTDFLSQTFLRKQTYLLKGLLRDKGGAGAASCKVSVMREWIGEQEEAGTWIENQFKALCATYELLLADPRPANLKRVQLKGRAPQLSWKVPNEKGNHVIVTLFDAEGRVGHDSIKKVPYPLIQAMLEIESWRITLNYLSNLHYYALSAGSECLSQVTAVDEWRKMAPKDSSEG